MNILKEADKLVYGDREKDYGNVTDNFNLIAKGWEALLGCKVTAEDVGLCMIWLKTARQKVRNKRDNLTDIAGYAATLEKMQDEGLNKVHEAIKKDNADAQKTWDGITEELKRNRAKHTERVAINDNEMVGLRVQGHWREEPPQRAHHLKCWPAYFQDVKSGAKDFEVRKNDRDFRVGDNLRLFEFDPVSNTSTGDTVSKYIKYILPGGEFGIEKDYVILGLK